MPRLECSICDCRFLSSGSRRQSRCTSCRFHGHSQGTEQHSSPQDLGERHLNSGESLLESTIESPIPPSPKQIVDDAERVAASPRQLAAAEASMARPASPQSPMPPGDDIDRPLSLTATSTEPLMAAEAHGGGAVAPARNDQVLAAGHSWSLTSPSVEKDADHADVQDNRQQDISHGQNSPNNQKILLRNSFPTRRRSQTTMSARPLSSSTAPLLQLIYRSL